MYRTQLEDQALPIEDSAVKRYVFAITKARELRIVNRWTKQILSSLNKYKPSEYPLFKEEKRMRAGRQLTTPRMLDLTTVQTDEMVEPSDKPDVQEKSEKDKEPASEAETAPSSKAALSSDQTSSTAQQASPSPSKAESK